MLIHTMKCKSLALGIALMSGSRNYEAEDYPLGAPYPLYLSVSSELSSK